VPPTSLPMQSADQLGGILGVVSRILDSMGEVGVGVLTFAETVFPPIPSEIILPLAGFNARIGDFNVWLVLVTATVGSYLGALVLYWLGHVFGERRAIGLLSRLPLVDREDFEQASGWFGRHGRSAVFFGRLIPGVRSLISLPAGAKRMPLLTFSAFTIAGSLLWNSLLVFGGYLLGSQYELVDEYSHVLDYAVIAVLAAIVVWLVVRRIRKVRRSA
jgi:membrane protein DedA with SNARE-associated domain